MAAEEIKAKLQEIKEKIESWQSSLSEMLEFKKNEYKKIREKLNETKEKPTPEEIKIIEEIDEEINKTVEIKIFEFIDK